MGELHVAGKQILEAMDRLNNVSAKVNSGSKNMIEASEGVTAAIDVVLNVTTDVSASANEITAGISHVSQAMVQVTDLCGSLGEINDELEHEAEQFKTESDDAEDVISDDLVENMETNDDFTMSDDNDFDSDIEGDEPPEESKAELLVGAGDVSD